jgi:pimeloyl-ACP methyl ester carboxylesterase
VLDDGVTVEGKRDLPIAPPPSAGWPVLLVVEGEARADVDGTVVAPPALPDDCRGAGPDGVRSDGTSVACTKVDQALAARIAGLGMAVFRMGARGVTLDPANPFQVHIDPATRGTATLSRRAADVSALAAHLAGDTRFDAAHTYVWGVSEGTAVASVYAAGKPAGFAGAVLIGPVLASPQDLAFHRAVGVQFDQLLAVADADGDRRVSASEYAAANLFADPPGFRAGDPTFRDTLRAYMRLGRTTTFAAFDEDGDGSLARTEVEARLLEDLWLPELAAVAAKDAAKVALFDPDHSLAQLTEDFAAPAPANALLALDVPLTLLVGKDDLRTPASQFDWFVPRAMMAGRMVLVAQVIDGHGGKALEDAGVTRLVELGWPRR